MSFSTTVIESEIEKTIQQGTAERMIWDHTIPGLGLRISPKGRASFILMYRFQGALRKLTIGRFGAISIAQAKTLAKQYHSQIVSGVDPALRKRQLRDGDTMKDLCNKYIAEHVPKKKTGKEDISKIRRKILPAFGSRKISSITHADIVRFHKNYGAPIQANHCLALLSTMFNLAKYWGMIERTADNPAIGVKKNPEKARNRYISEVEMPRLLAAIEEWHDIYIRSAMQICLFTGIRQKSVMSLKWDDVDLDTGRLRETAAKTSKAGEVITHLLTKASIEVLKQIPRNTADPYVFADGNRVKSQTQKMWTAWVKIKATAGIRETAEDRLWLHDLRRTLGSWLVKNNYSTNVAKTALNHKSLVAAQRYQHISDGNLVQTAMEDVTQKMLATRKPDQTGGAKSS